jgi:hypothetical protein
MRPMTYWEETPYELDVLSMWCGRVIMFLEFRVRAETADANGNFVETVRCAYVHLMSTYTPPEGECEVLHQRGQLMLYETSPPILYVVPISFILGKLPVVRAGDTGRIPWPGPRPDANLKRVCYPDGKCDEHATDKSGSPLYFVNHHAVAWSRIL